VHASPFGSIAEHCATPRLMGQGYVTFRGSFALNPVCE
jgi:hypothetical protein